MSLEGEAELQMGMQPRWTLGLQPWQTLSKGPSCAMPGLLTRGNWGILKHKQEKSHQILQE